MTPCSLHSTMSWFIHTSYCKAFGLIRLRLKEIKLPTHAGFLIVVLAKHNQRLQSMKRGGLHGWAIQSSPHTGDSFPSLYWLLRRSCTSLPSPPLLVRQNAEKWIRLCLEAPLFSTADRATLENSLTPKQWQLVIRGREGLLLGHLAFLELIVRY